MTALFTNWLKRFGLVNKPQKQARVTDSCYIGVRTTGEVKRKLVAMSERSYRSLSKEVERALLQYTASEP